MELKFNEPIVGNPINPYEQQYSDTCAIKSQQLILQDFGVNVTEDELVQYSFDHGWYQGNGTSLEDVGRLLEVAGIPCTQTVNTNVFDLANELQQGHKVIVAVDSDELWGNSLWEWLKDFFFGEVPDHALIVAGIDMTDSNNPLIVVTDPGTGDAAKAYPLDQFMDAWKDSNCFMVSTDVPTPENVKIFEDNSMTGYHLSNICGVDYDSFYNFMDYSHTIDNAMQFDLFYNDIFSQFGDLGYDFAWMNTIEFSDWMSQYDLPSFEPVVPPMPLYDPSSFNYMDLGFN